MPAEPTMSSDAPIAFHEFPAATRDAWRRLVERALKGADFEKALVSQSQDGLRIEPVYEKAVGLEPVLRPPARPWRIGQRVDHPEPAEASRLALADLEGGADALVLALAGAPTARGFGLRASDAEALDLALSGVMLDLVALSVETAPFAGRPAAEALTALASRRDHDPGALTVDFGLDPAGDLARSGALPVPWPDLSARFAGTASAIRAFGGTSARVDARAYHEAGAGEAQELAAALATGICYLRALEAGGFDIDEARRKLSFLLVADTDEFLTIAKLRAFRRLWAEVERACGLDPAPAALAVETAWRTMTRRDPHVNLLRGTVAAYAAGIGGADRVTILPFTAALGLPDAFARRLARNIQAILLEESQLWRVADPVAGSGAFEALTDGLADEAWERFREIEREGGIVASLEAGLIQGRIAAVRARRERAVATRRDPLVGTSEFPDLRATSVAVLMAASASLDEAPPPRAGAGTALPSRRLAEPYEVLRDRSDAILAASGARPRVFLATLGSAAEFTARATFARSAFESVGMEAVGGESYGSREELISAFRSAEAATACLCSSDNLYDAEGEEAARALAAAGARTIALAGRPGEREAAFRAAGVALFVQAGSNLPALLGPLLR